MATYHAKSLTMTKNGDEYIIDPLQGNDAAFMDFTVNIDEEDWDLNSSLYTYVWQNQHLTQNSAIQTWFKDGVRDGIVCDIKVTKTTGQVTFSMEEAPIGDVSILVRIMDTRVLGNTYPIDADQISTNAVVGETEVQGALEDLDSRVTTNAEGLANHNHDARYYTESEVDTLVNGLNQRINLLDPEQGVGIFTDVAFSIATTDWTLSNGAYTYTYQNPILTARSGIHVMYDSSFRTALKGDIDTVKSTGSILFTTNRPPVGTLTGTIRVFDSVQGVLAVDKGGTGATTAAGSRDNLGISGVATVVEGTTNNSGHTISSGEYFIANGAKYKATATIDTSATWADKSTSVSDHDLINALNSNLTPEDVSSNVARNTTNVSALNGSAVYIIGKIVIANIRITINTELSANAQELVTGLPVPLRSVVIIASALGQANSPNGTTRPFELTTSGKITNYWRKVPADEYVMQFSYVKA